MHLVTLNSLAGLALTITTLPNTFLFFGFNAGFIRHLILHTPGMSVRTMIPIIYPVPERSQRSPHTSHLEKKVEVFAAEESPNQEVTRSVEVQHVHCNKASVHPCKPSLRYLRQFSLSL